MWIVDVVFENQKKNSPVIKDDGCLGSFRTGQGELSAKGFCAAVNGVCK